MTVRVSEPMEQNRLCCGDNMKKNLSNAIAAIEANCLECCAYEKSEVKFCSSTSCPLYRWRNASARNKYLEPARKMTEKQRAKALANLKRGA
jgi:hypothetical protein